MDNWQIQDAKARFSALLAQACSQGPQGITRHGREQAVLLSVEDYRALVARQPDFRAHLLGGPKLRSFSIPREPDTGRDVDLD